MADILEYNIGLIIGIVNEKINQINGLDNKKKENDGEAVQGTAEMLMKM